MKAFLLVLIFALFSVNASAGQEKTAMCAGCHGAQGVSVNPDWPNLAGQHASYLSKQLRDYKEGSMRSAAIMTPMVMQLSDDDIKEIAEFYAGLPLPAGKAPEKNSSRGEELYRRGDLDKHITACIACHGPQGTGNAQAGFPVIAGQQPGYTVQQLLAFKNKLRKNDLNSIMRDISSRMSQEDMEAIANYLARMAVI